MTPPPDPKPLIDMARRVMHEPPIKDSGMKIYLAGPMSGIPAHNFPAFNDAAKRLRAMGHIVINPAEVHPDTQALGAEPSPEQLWRACMKADIALLIQCDAVAFLPGWEKSRGASLEVYIAKALGLPILDAEAIGVEVRPYNPHECADWDCDPHEAHGEIRQDGTVEPGHARKAEGEDAQ